MFYLCYQSTSKVPIDQKLINNILEISKMNNRQSNVTGMLLINNDIFFQILEGEEESVEKLFTKIQSDNRHTSVHRLLSGYESERSFANWSMGFKILSEGELITFNRYLDLEHKDFRNLEESSISGDNFLLQFLKNFFDGCL